MQRETRIAANEVREDAPKILIVDDDATHRERLARAFRERGFEATTASIGTPSLAMTEWEHIERVLASCGGNVSEAARRLGIHRRSLQRRRNRGRPRR